MKIKGEQDMSTIKKLLIANRGEIAIRIARTATEMGIHTVALYSKDDDNSLHIQYADESIELPGVGVGAYLNIDSIVEAAHSTGCDAVHPGYGLLSENADFAKACLDKGLIFVGPDINTLQSFGDKISARALARSAGIAVIEGSDQVSSAADVSAFFNALDQAPIMLKAVNGGGGRGMRMVMQADQIEAAFTRCQAEALTAFGADQLYVERFLPTVRHIEVQIVGDGSDVVHLWERDCTLQRRNQKMVELAPAPGLNADIRQQLLDAAIRIGEACHYKGLGTVEFLLELDQQGEACGFYFIETNPRIQVEHTITEEVTGIDLVEVQLRLAAGASLRDIGLEQASIPKPVGYALQLRINTETLNDQGEMVPVGGTLNQVQFPGGPGIRIDTYAYAGYRTNPNFDSLLAKLIVHTRSDHVSQVLVKAERALSEVSIKGVDTNVDFLRRLLKMPEVAAWQVSVRGIESRLKDLLNDDSDTPKKRYIEADTAIASTTSGDQVTIYPEGTTAVCAPLQSVLVSLEVAEGQSVNRGDELAVVEAMKMQHVITASCAGIVLELKAQAGEMLDVDQAIVLLREAADSGETQSVVHEVDIDSVRPDLQGLQDRLALTLDAARPAAVEKRYARGQRTARENISDLCDESSFLEYGQLVYAAQRRKRSAEELMKTTPADGVVAGFGTINADKFAEHNSRAAVLSYDAMVMAGTQGIHGHHKTDRVFEVAVEQSLPVVFFTEGGGGRPGDDDFEHIAASALDIKTFYTIATLRADKPNIAINDGFCFAGNAAMFGCCDIKIATRNAWIGMGGPAMIEAGGLGTFSPKDIGPAAVHSRSGLLDLMVDDDVQAVESAKRIFSYFQGSVTDWEVNDQRLLRHAIPEDRKRVYDVRSVIDTLADRETFLELKRDYGLAMVSGFIRIEGRPFGLIANNPMHLGGAIDAEAADKAGRFITLCNKFNLPVLSLCDTPGFMVGPDSEQAGAAQRACELMLAGANAEVPIMVVCLRKAYGLGAQGMAGASFAATVATIAWPTAELGPMGLEGGVRLGYKRELEAQPDEKSRSALFEKLVQQAYDAGSALSVASLLEIDAVIDPIDTRKWIVNRLNQV